MAGLAVADFVGGVAGDAYAEAAVDFAVHFAEHHGGVYLASAEFREAFEGEARVLAVGRKYG